MNTERDCDYDSETGKVGECAEKYQDLTIERSVFHPSYIKSTLHNDIALIRTTKPIDFRPRNARPICLPIGTAVKSKASKVSLYKVKNT